jgi:hypothetical protein
MNLKCEKTKYYTDAELEVCFSASPKLKKSKGVRDYSIKRDSCRLIPGIRIFL